MEIKAGQVVTFVAETDAGGLPDFVGMHPLQAHGGDTPSPFTDAFDKSTGKVTFAGAGDFGYICGNHATMTGAIRVKP